MTPERKLRILCLHGYQGSGDVLRQQMASLAEGVGALTEFVYIDAPTLARGDFGWWHAVALGDSAMRGDPGVLPGVKRYQGWPASRDFIVSLFENEGPFDGVFGFSQGGALTGLLVGLRAPDRNLTAEKPLAFDFAMMVGGFVGTDPDLAALYEAKEAYALPSIHIIGRSDLVVPPENSRALAAKFKDPLIVEHDGGHVVVATLDVRQRVAAFLQERLRKPKAHAAPPPPSLSATPLALAETLQWTAGQPPSVDLSGVQAVDLPGPVSTAGRTTVLPRRPGADKATAFEAQPRFHLVRTLGEGAMGQVELVRDNDIRRTVAVKKILTSVKSEDMLLRFADEIRVVGQLEHPGIVPIYDVGRSDDDQIYLVMKHLQGETMEEIIGRLKAGEPAYVDRYTPEYRARLFLGVIDAIGYAHARGILHRDIKPANIMIGPWGEVTVMDWGIAKPIGDTCEVKDVAPSTPAVPEPKIGRLLETEIGSLAGTPLYMSPEQAAGKNDELDARSDVYSLCIVLYEWLVLRHPLQDKGSVAEVLTALVLQDYSPDELFGPAQAAMIPMEYIWIIVKGLARDRDQRFQTAKELEMAIKGVQDGDIKIQCDITLAKNYVNRFSHWIDRHPTLYMRLFRAAKVVAFAAILATVGGVLWKVVSSPLILG